MKHCRVLYFQKMKIVFRGLPYTKNIQQKKNLLQLKEKLNISDLSRYRFFDSHEGALLRVFYWQNKWYISTHRKLDAFRSKWASKLSFGEMFKSAIEYQYENQDSEFYKYMQNFVNNDESNTNKGSKNILEIY